MIFIKNLNFYYEKTHILHNINVSFPNEKITSLIGPSGSGKSTLLRCINRVFELHSGQKATGEIYLNKQNLLDSKIDVNILRKKIGMVFQKPTPFPMTIYENIAFALRLHENIKKKELDYRVEESLKKAALWNEVKDKLHEDGTHLSGGQQQRLCIARTIAIKPLVLLLDEPTSALDPISSSSIEKLILELKKDFCILLVTHNLKQAKRISDYTIFLQNGYIVEHQISKNFFSNPIFDKTKFYIKNH